MGFLRKDWKFLWAKYTDWKLLWAKYALRRRTIHGFRWDWNSGLSHESFNIEVFNEPMILRPGNCFIDAGAHAGRWTIPASKFYKQVLAVEPWPETMKILKRNLAMNKIRNVRTLEWALGAKVGTVEFYLYKELSMNSVLARHMGAEHDDYSALSRAFVPMTTLDNVVNDYDLTPSVVKIDVEGAELDVLKGGLETIRKFKPTLLVEIHVQEHDHQVKSLLPDFTWTTNYRELAGKRRQLHLAGVPHE